MASAIQSSTSDSLERFIQFCPRDTRTLMEVLRRLAPDNIRDLERRADMTTVVAGILAKKPDEIRVSSSQSKI